LSTPCEQPTKIAHDENALRTVKRELRVIQGWPLNSRKISLQKLSEVAREPVLAKSVVRT